MSRVLERVWEQTERSTGKVAARSRMDGWLVGANRDHLLKMRGRPNTFSGLGKMISDSRGSKRRDAHNLVERNMHRDENDAYLPLRTHSHCSEHEA